MITTNVNVEFLNEIAEAMRELCQEVAELRGWDNLPYYYQRRELNSIINNVPKHDIDNNANR